MKKSSLSLTPAIGWFIVSTILLTLPGSDIPQEDWLDKIWFDKWVHIGMFAIMTVLWCRSWHSLKTNISPQKLRRSFIIIGIIWIAYGIGMEFVQKYFIPNRSFDIGDMVADAAGCVAGFLFSTRRYIKK
ncbi:MAG: VanZ family protein [Bacteroidota bacterium]|nr:VanZ family protein [Bacteroidota bacterium]